MVEVTGVIEVVVVKVAAVVVVVVVVAVVVVVVVEEAVELVIVGVVGVCEVLVKHPPDRFVGAGHCGAVLQGSCFHQSCPPGDMQTYLRHPGNSTWGDLVTKLRETHGTRI